MATTLIHCVFRLVLIFFFFHTGRITKYYHPIAYNSNLAFILAFFACSYRPTIIKIDMFNKIL